MARNISIERYRNIGISAPVGEDRTTTIERMAFHAEFNHKIGENSDWTEQKAAHGTTQNAVVTAALWRGMNMQFPEHHINIIDTPDHVGFSLEGERSMRVLDGVCMVCCASNDIQTESVKAWRLARKYRVPRLIFVNNMDRQGADFFRVVEQIESRFRGSPVPLQVPIVTEDRFEGVIDLIQMRAILWDESSQGTKFEYADISSDLLSVANDWRAKMIEIAAEASENLMNRYLDGEELSSDEVKTALRQRTIAGDIVPVLCGSASNNKGIQAVLDAFVDYLPSPLEIPPVQGFDQYDQAAHRTASDDVPFSALAFKLMNAPSMGELTLFRVYSGVIKSGDTVYNATKGKQERIGRMVQICAHQPQDTLEVHAGDIAAAVGLNDITPGDTLSDQAQVITLERIQLREAVVHVAVQPKTKADEEKMGIALNRLAKEDPSFKVRTDEQSGQTIISGVDETHIESLVGRMQQEFNLEADVGAPRVAYLETIKQVIEIEGKHIKQAGGKGQYGHVYMRLEPLGQGAGYEFVSTIKGEVVPKEFIPGVEQGIRRALLQGILAGYPVVDVKVTLFDGSYHDVDSSPIAFETAAYIAIKDGLRKASPIILEPIMTVVVETPEEYMGDVMGDLSSRRGTLQGMNDEGFGIKIITAEVPLAEMFGYSTALHSLSQGQASYSMEFKHYSETSRDVAEVIISRANG